jgi:hypothetical protein
MAAKDEGSGEGADDRRRRLEAALRANLARRKEQRRSRAAEAEPTVTAGEREPEGKA